MVFNSRTSGPPNFETQIAFMEVGNEDILFSKIEVEEK